MVGTRPNLVKMAPLYFKLKSHEIFSPRIIHTGQHYDKAMSADILSNFKIKEEEITHTRQNISSSPFTNLTHRAFVALNELRPHLTVVFGDVNASLASALASKELKIPIAHIEAGLRSFDDSMPEESNRRLIDHMSKVLFTTEPSGNLNLANEGIPDDRVHFVGNIMIDSWDHAQSTNHNLRKDYILWTCHRPSNVDNVESLQKMLRLLQFAQTERKVIWPIHPRTREKLKALDWQHRLEGASYENVNILPPQDYLTFSSLLKEAAVVVTDSGGVQEEACAAGVPCLTIRNNTERPITIEVGANRLIPQLDLDIFKSEMAWALLHKGDWPRPRLWDGQVASRIVDHLEVLFGIKQVLDLRNSN